MFLSNWRHPCALVSLLLAAGCAGVPLEQGRSNVRTLVQQRVALADATPLPAPVTAGDTTLDAQIAQWLQQPLALETAQRIALVRSPRLLAAYARLGLDAADAFEASRLENPAIGLSWLLPQGAAEGRKFGASATLGFTELLLRRTRREITAAQFEATQREVAAEVLDLLADAQQAWLEGVAAGQRLAVRQSIADAAALSAELAERYQQAGNLNQLELQVQRAEASQARIELQTAQLELADARARLQALLGLRAGESAWTLPDALPVIPEEASAADVQAWQARALAGRLDLAAARQRAAALELQWRTARRYRLLGDVRLGAELDREGDGERRAGPTLELGLPLFQQGQGAIARAAAQRDAAHAGVHRLEVEIAAEVEQQLRRLELARLQAALYRDALIPQREAIVARLREQANYMLVDQFAVLLARQQEYAAYAGYVDAVLRYWSTQVELLRAMGSERSTEVQP